MTLDSLNRLCKWRAVLAGWHLGTRAKDEPGVAAMRDLRELTMILRAEMNAVCALMVKKGVFTEKEHARALEREADLMNTDMERRFPGWRSSNDGMVAYDLDLAQDTANRLGFPP
jgi:hypothetical protein